MKTLDAAFSSLFVKNARLGPPPELLRRLDDEDFDSQALLQELFGDTYSRVGTDVIGDASRTLAKNVGGTVIDALSPTLRGSVRGGQIGLLGGGIGGASLAGFLAHRALKRRAEEAEDAELAQAATMGPLARGALTGGAALGGGILGAGMGLAAGVPAGAVTGTLAPSLFV